VTVGFWVNVCRGDVNCVLFKAEFTHPNVVSKSFLKHKMKCSPCSFSYNAYMKGEGAVKHAVSCIFMNFEVPIVCTFTRL